MTWIDGRRCGLVDPALVRIIDGAFETDNGRAGPGLPARRLCERLSRDESLRRNFFGGYDPLGSDLSAIDSWIRPGRRFDRPELRFAVLSDDGVTIAGGIGLTPSAANRQDLSYFIYPEFRGRGLARRSVRAALNHNETQSSVIRALCQRVNLASINTAVAAGMRYARNCLHDVTGETVVCYERAPRI